MLAFYILIILYMEFSCSGGREVGYDWDLKEIAFTLVSDSFNVQQIIYSFHVDFLFSWVDALH